MTPRFLNQKDLHIKASLTHDVEATASSGFEKVRLISGFPDFSFADIDMSCEFLGKRQSLPLIIAPLTGGGSLSKKINRRLARAAETLGLGMAVGSQKLMLDNLAPADSYLLRDIAPTIPLLANLGIVHVKRGRDYLLRAVESIQADGLILYVNHIQEVLQEGGEKDFTGILTSLEEIIADFPYPVILKEVGAGVPENLMKWVADKSGIRGLDVAGLGGTNWARIEGLMSHRDYTLYESMGTETTEAILRAKSYLNLHTDRYLIASGGIRSGVDMAKAMAMGANMTAIGLPFLRWASKSVDQIISGINGLRQEFQVALWFTGSRNLSELSGKYSCK